MYVAALVFCKRPTLAWWGMSNSYAGTVCEFRLAVIHTQSQSARVHSAVHSLLVLMVHARDILERLSQSKSSNPSCFEWTKQLRYYWISEDEQCDVEQLEAKYVLLFRIGEPKKKRGLPCEYESTRLR